MKKKFTYLRSLVFLSALLFFSTGSYASHILGMDLYYTWVSGNTYTITAILYGDCSPSSASAFSSLPTSTPNICVYRGSTYVTTLTLHIQAPSAGVDITPVCPAEVGHTQCENTSSTIPGIKKFVYTANYTLPAPTTSTCWQFAYFAENGSGVSSGRSANITNMVNASGTSIELVDTLDNSVYPYNSSTQFSVIPTPFFCINNPDTYNPGAVNPLDSFQIDLIPAMNCAYSSGCQFGTPCTYTGTAWSPPPVPVSATDPLEVVAGSYTYNSSTGQLNFTPNAIQRATVVYNCREFRQGTTSYVGSCQREMNFLVETCTNTAPAGAVDSALGGTLIDSVHFTICANTGPFNLYFDPRETGSANTITVSSTGLPTGATLTVVGNGTTTPHATFSWTSNGIAPGTYIFYVTYTDNNCPLVGTTTQAITVIITPGPTVTYTVISPATCVAKEVLTITPGGNGSPWNINVTGNATQSFTGVTTAFTDSLSPGVDTIEIASAAGSGCNSYIPITIAGPINITISVTNPTLCAPSNGSFTVSGLTAGSSYTIYYTINGSPYSVVMTANPSGQIVITGLPAGNYTNVYAMSTVSGCSSNILAFAMVNALTPVPPTPTSNAPICADSTLLLFATDTATGIAYSWTGPNGFTSANQNPTISNAQTNASGVYTVTITKTATGCNSFNTINITVKPTPVIPVVTASNPCQGSAFNLFAVSTAGATYNWNGPAGFTSAIQNPTISPAGISNSGAYTVVATLNGCPSIPGLGTFTVYPTPPAPVVTDSTYCQGIPIAPLSATGSNLLWYTSGTGGIGSTVVPIPSDSIAGTTTWYVSQTVNGCESSRTPETITILYLPVFTISGNTTLCLDASSTLSYSGLPLAAPAYTWTIPVGASILTGSTTSDSITVQFDSLHSQIVTLTATDYGGKCSTTESVPVTVVAPPISQFYVKPNICIGDTVVVALSYKSPSATVFAWDFDGATIIAANSNSGGPYSLSWTDTGIHTIKLVTSTDIGCTTPPVYDTFNVHGLPDATINLPKSDICLEDTVMLSAVTNVYNDVYTWGPAHFFDWGNEPVSNNGSTIMGIIQVAGDVTLTVTDPFGCVASNSLYLDPQPCCTLAFPNSFSPNGDGHNDVFRPIMAGYHIFHIFRVVNRWGQTVYETSNTNGAWDGTFNGVPQDIGVYYYYLKYDCDGKTMEAKGDVTLIR